MHKHCSSSCIKSIGSRCRENDFFVFYYSGHGTEVPDENGDEKDGMDEAFCFVTPSGQVNRSSLMTDDEFVDALLKGVHEDTNLLVLADCCHSGTIVDLQKSSWSQRSAVAMVGCTDAQTSADIGVGGVFTHSLLLAMEKLSQDDHYAVGKLYNTTVKENERVFQGKQTITLQCSVHTEPNKLPWPFVPKPKGSYESPLRSAKNKNVAQRYGLDGPTGGTRALNVDGIRATDRGIDIGDYKDVPDDLAQWAKDNDIDLGSDYEDEELENG